MRLLPSAANNQASGRKLSVWHLNPVTLLRLLPNLKTPQPPTRPRPGRRNREKGVKVVGAYQRGKSHRRLAQVASSSYSSMPCACGSPIPLSSVTPANASLILLPRASFTVRACWHAWQILPWPLFAWLHESGLANFRQHQNARKMVMLHWFLCSPSPFAGQSPLSLRILPIPSLSSLYPSRDK